VSGIQKAVQKSPDYRPRHHLFQSSFATRTRLRKSVMDEEDRLLVSRRALMVSGAAAATGAALPADGAALRTAGDTDDISEVGVTLRVNGQDRTLTLDTRTTLLDALREHLRLTGTKKGCDHGQCGACTVLVNGTRINSCLSLAIQHQGDQVTTIEGLGAPDRLHPLQAAFIECDGFQCGYCTPGQICSAVAVLAELQAGVPSHVQDDIAAAPKLSRAELRERMSGNICRCGAYSNIVDAILSVAGGAA
jgi:xanthine dehydrogenase YagT iron-sulfur-binding subunit